MPLGGFVPSRSTVGGFAPLRLGGFVPLELQLGSAASRPSSCSSASSQRSEASGRRMWAKTVWERSTPDLLQEQRMGDGGPRSVKAGDARQVMTQLREASSDQSRAGCNPERVGFDLNGY